MAAPNDLYAAIIYLGKRIRGNGKSNGLENKAEEDKTAKKTGCGEHYAVCGLPYEECVKYTGKNK